MKRRALILACLLGALGCQERQERLESPPLGRVDAGPRADLGAYDLGVLDGGELDAGTSDGDGGRRPDSGLVECDGVSGGHVSTQSQFELLRGCESFTGWVTLSESTTDLSPLSSLRYANWLYVTKDFEGTDLRGLERLERVDHLTVRGPRLESLSGLDNLSEISLELIVGQTKLRQIDLPLVTSISSRFTLYNNAELESLAGLSSLRYVRLFVLTSTTSHAALPQSEIDAFLERVETEQVSFAPGGRPAYLHKLGPPSLNRRHGSAITTVSPNDKSMARFVNEGPARDL